MSIKSLCISASMKLSVQCPSCLLYSSPVILCWTPVCHVEVEVCPPYKFLSWLRQARRLKCVITCVILETGWRKAVLAVFGGVWVGVFFVCMCVCFCEWLACNLVSCKISLSLHQDTNFWDAYLMLSLIKRTMCRWWRNI